LVFFIFEYNFVDSKHLKYRRLVLELQWMAVGRLVSSFVARNLFFFFFFKLLGYFATEENR
jgi:hypothetical protein